MIRHRCLVAMLALLGATAVARAAVDCPTREGALDHVCAADGVTACTPEFPAMPSPVCTDTRPAAACPGPGNKCEIAFVTGRNTSFRGVLTVTIDDSVEDPVRTPTGSNITAVVMTLDLGKKGIISQIYQDTTDPTQDPVDFYGLPLFENVLNSQDDIDPDTGKVRGLNDIVFRGLDDEMSSALRTIFGTTGTAVLTKIGNVQVTDQAATGLGTVLRVKVKGGFVE